VEWNSLPFNLPQGHLYPSAVSPGVKDVFVWLTETPAPSDFLFVVCYTNALTYLLTYLLTSTFDVAAHLDGGLTGPPGKCQAVRSALYFEMT